MRKYSELLKNIAGEFHILQGTEESVEMYKCRLTYSTIGRMAYASLWDIQEDGQPVSIVHFKRRIYQLLNGYMEMYPEIRPLISLDAEQLGNEIYDIYVKTGYIYHAPNRLAPAAPCLSKATSVYLTKGMPLYLKQCLSGIGTYTTKADGRFKENSVRDMFMLNGIESSWKDAIRGIQWNKAPDSSQFEFLRLAPPFNRGYWVNQPTKEDVISLARAKSLGTQLYYFYQHNDQQLYVSPIPDWRVREPVTQNDNSNYRALSNGLLKSLSVLPPIRYHISGELIAIYLDYLPEPATLNFIKLYSWPASFQTSPSDFRRTCSRDIFSVLKDTLEYLGYQFTEE